MRVLFVCSGNAYRSPIAEALLKKYRPDVQAESAGTYPILPGISESARKFLEKENALNYLKGAPERLEGKRADKYDLIVVMKPQYRDIVLSRCPGCESRIVVWNVEDPYFLPERETKIFEQIKRKVEELANAI